MRKLLLFFILVLFGVSSAVHVAEADSSKKDVVLFYDVQNEIISAQKKNGDFAKGREEFENSLKKYYSGRFNVVDTKPAIMSGGALNLRQMLNTSGSALPVVVQIRLLGSGSDTVTYRNGLGAVFNAVVPTVQMSYKELFGDRNHSVFRVVDYGTGFHKAETGASHLRGIYIKDNDRTLVKNGVNAYIYDVCSFTPPNQYTEPQAYNRYVGIFLGDNSVLSSLPSISLQEPQLPQNNELTATTENRPQATFSHGDRDNFTIEQFMAIQNGMTYQQCVEILGKDGELVNESAAAGSVIQIYAWKNQDGSFMSIGFYNGRVTNKSQGGLKNANKEASADRGNTAFHLTMNHFIAIQNGMTYQQCVDILGRDGELANESAVAGSVIQVYAWKNQDGSFISIGFHNGRVTNKSQGGLR